MAVKPAACKKPCIWASAKALFFRLHILDGGFDNDLGDWGEFNITLPQLRSAMHNGLL